MVPSMSGQHAGSDLTSEDGSRSGRRVRARRTDSCGTQQHPADSAQQTAGGGSMCTVTDLRGLPNGGGACGAPRRAGASEGGSNLMMGPPGSDSNNGSSFHAFHAGSAGNNGGSGAFSQMPVSAGMQPDWISMAAAAGQQQVIIGVNN